MYFGFKIEDFLKLCIHGSMFSFAGKNGLTNVKFMYWSLCFLNYNFFLNTQYVLLLKKY